MLTPKRPTRELVLCKDLTNILHYVESLEKLVENMLDAWIEVTELGDTPSRFTDYFEDAKKVVDQICE